MLENKKFQRKDEDFTCLHCGAEVIGNGYTNHCPQCLWSKHVDVHPGDRMERCGGLMTPVSAEVATAGYVLRQRCEECGVQRKNKAVEGDNFDLIIELSKNPAAIQ